MNITHGLTGTPEWKAWSSMRERCNNPRHPSYHNYGGRGITICSLWDDFAAFLEDVGPRPSPEHSLDRINNEGNYEPGNVRWSTRKEQARNRRPNRFVEFRGRRMVLKEAAELAGIKYSTVKRRIGPYGWTVEEALNTPTGGAKCSEVESTSFWMHSGEAAGRENLPLGSPTNTR